MIILLYKRRICCITKLLWRVCAWRISMVDFMIEQRVFGGDARRRTASERVPRQFANNASSQGRLVVVACWLALTAGAPAARRRHTPEYLIRRHRDMVGASRNCNFKSPPCDDDAELWATGQASPVDPPPPWPATRPRWSTLTFHLSC